MFQHAYGICHVKDMETNEQGQIFRVDMTKTFGLLKQANYRGYCSMEFDNPWRPISRNDRLDRPDAALSRLDCFLVPSHRVHFSSCNTGRTSGHSQMSPQKLQRRTYDSRERVVVILVIETVLACRVVHEGCGRFAAIAAVTKRSMEAFIPGSSSCPALATKSGMWTHCHPDRKWASTSQKLRCFMLDVSRRPLDIQIRIETQAGSARNVVVAAGRRSAMGPPPDQAISAMRRDRR